MAGQVPRLLPGRTRKRYVWKCIDVCRYHKKPLRAARQGTRTLCVSLHGAKCLIFSWTLKTDVKLMICALVSEDGTLQEMPLARLAVGLRRISASCICATFIRCHIVVSRERGSFSSKRDKEKLRLPGPY